MAFDYQGMQDIATSLLTEFNQGTIVLRQTAVAAGPDIFTPGTETVTNTPLKATARRVSQKYVNGTTIQATDNQVILGVPLVTPTLKDVLIIDGVEHRINDLRRVPAAGTPIVWIAFISG